MRVPAEWETQAGVWLCYPSSVEHWGVRLGKIREFVLDLSKKILEFQPVFMVFHEPELMATVREKMGHHPHPLHAIPLVHNDLWIRDYGPFFMLSESNLSIRQFRFNSWGEKFPPWDLEKTFSERWAQKYKVPFSMSMLTLEGGAFDFNGHGVALTTRPCLVNPNRNPGLGEEEIRREICRHLNLDELIILPFGLMGDHTDGHVDNLVRFVSERKVIMPEASSGDVNEKSLLQIKHRLATWRHPSQGWALEIVECPSLAPRPFGKNWLPRSYLNFIYVNGGLLFPVYGEDSQTITQKVFEQCFPDRKVIPIECSLLLEEGGALHCMTRQQPQSNAFEI